MNQAKIEVLKKSKYLIISLITSLIGFLLTNSLCFDIIIAYNTITLAIRLDNVNLEQ